MSEHHFVITDRLWQRITPLLPGQPPFWIRGEESASPYWPGGAWRVLLAPVVSPSRTVQWGEGAAPQSDIGIGSLTRVVDKVSVCLVWWGWNWAWRRCRY